MDACGCTDIVNISYAGHAEGREKTQNQKKKVLVKCVSRVEYKEVICAIHMHVANAYICL
jgi:hypothetical protein